MHEDEYSWGGTPLKGAHWLRSGGEQGKFAFDLQLFAENWQLVSTVGGKVTLEIDLGTLPRGTEVNITDGNNSYGTVGWQEPGILRITFINQTSPIQAVNVSGQAYVEIYNGQFLASECKVNFQGKGGKLVLFKVNGDDNGDGGGWIWIEQNSDQPAEITYNSGENSLVSARNAEVTINNTFAHLPDNGILKHDTAWHSSQESNGCVLLADNEGKLTVARGDFWTDRTVFLDDGNGAGTTGVANVYDDSGKVVAKFADGFKGSYNVDTNTRTIFPEQGGFGVGAGGKEGDDKTDYAYRVNVPDKTIDVGWVDKYGQIAEKLGSVSKRAYADIAKVSLKLPENVTDLKAANDYGLTLDIKTVTVEATDTLVLESPPEGMDTVIYQNGKGTTRYVTLRKTAEGYELAAGNEAVAVNREKLSEKLTLTQGQVKLVAGNIIVAGTEYTVGTDGAALGLGGSDGKQAILTAGTVELDENESIAMAKDTTAIIHERSYIAAANGTILVNEDGNAKLTAGTVTLGEGESIIIGTAVYTATENGATIGNSNGTAKLTEGAVKLDAGGSISAGGVTYNVTPAEGEEECIVSADGSISGLAEGTRLTVVQDGEEFDCLVSGGELEVTKDSVTKNIPLNDGNSIAGSALEKALGEVLEESSNLDPRKPQTITTTPGKTKTPENYDPKKDTIKISQASGALEADQLILTEDGRMTYGDSFAEGAASNGVVDLSDAEQDKTYYTASLTDKDGGNRQLVAWSGTRSAVVDLRQETRGVIMKDGGNGKQDTFLGGKGKDDITLGTEDIAAGGKGNDNITMGKDASGAVVALKDGDGHDKVEGFRFGFGEEANAVSLRDGQSMSGVSVDSSGRLKVGTATLEFAGTDLKNSGQTDLLLKDSHGTHKAAVGRSLTAEGELADIYYGTGKEAEADFSNSGESDLVIDLNNSSSYGKTTASVYNVQKVKGSENADNTMVGQDGKNNTLIAGDGGSNRLYGGKGGRDHLVGSSTSEDTFYFGADSGRDEIENFGEEDAIGILGGSLSQASFDAGGRLKLNWQDESGNSSCLTFAGDMKDKVISYDFGNGLHGAKFGEKLTVADDTADFVDYYSSGSVDYYSSGSKEGDGELDISGGSDKKIWLDGSHGAVFDGFRKIDATTAAGSLELAGGEQGDSILGGQGESSLWGGAGGNDFLTGGSGYNEFYFGRGEGHDVITDSNNGDKVMLYNVALEDLDLARTGMDDSGNMVIRLQDGSSLTFRNYGAQGASTFQLSDSTWNYDRASGAWSRE